jgi:hypothetical protein
MRFICTENVDCKDREEDEKDEQGNQRKNSDVRYT